MNKKQMIINYNTEIEYTFRIARLGKVELYKTIFTYEDVECGAVPKFISVTNTNERLLDSSFSISIERIELVKE